MRLYSTSSRDHTASLQEAVTHGLAPDGGLYLPVEIPPLPSSVLEALPELSLPEIGFEVSRTLIGDEIPTDALRQIVESAVNFPAPLVQISPKISALELFHGPTLAFKDFGARYMAQLLSWFTRGEDQPLTILVATSGDTGGAVAQGFLGVPGIQVVILYPKGRVSFLQEQQLTTNGENIHAVEIDGSFDDCQRLVKEAFVDTALKAKLRLTSANSINIARLIPQSFYFFSAIGELGQNQGKIVFSVPSGNFGNLCAGVIARKMGAPIEHLLAATNENDAVPQFLESGIFQPRPSVQTISNAMDVGNPSNFIRLQHLIGAERDHFRAFISGYRYSDHETREAIEELFQESGYVSDPHGAIGFRALRDFLSTKNSEWGGAFLETAHPAKFPDEVQAIVGDALTCPERLAKFEDREKQATPMPPQFNEFKLFLSKLDE